MLDFVNMPINPETPRLFTVLSTFAGAGGSSLGYVWAGGKVDRKSTRLNSSHTVISYAVFCLKKKNKQSISHTETLASRTNTPDNSVTAYETQVIWRQSYCHSSISRRRTSCLYTQSTTNEHRH